MTKEQIENTFTYHAPFGTQLDRYQALREKAKELALLIIDSTPPSREQSMAISQLQLCTMLANAAIACNEAP
jgi:hypothetical protein